MKELIKKEIEYIHSHGKRQIDDYGKKYKYHFMIDFYLDELVRILNKKNSSLHYLITNQYGAYRSRLTRWIYEIVKELEIEKQNKKWWEFWK